MDFEWVAIDLGEVGWIALAFALGLLAQTVGLPPLVGYLAAGFVLGAQGVVSGTLIDKLSDLGITLLLFTVGLKINLRTLTRPQVWGVSTLHMLAVIVVFGLALLVLAATGLGPFERIGVGTAILLAFALSFSSTVFAVKALEARGELNALHGQVAIGILVMQDIAAVLFLAISAGELPSIYALALVLLLPARALLHALLARVGHGELLILYGFLLALGGAELFELVQLKGDLGALVLGVLVANHPKADEMAKRMLAFKDLFLIAFFLSIGLSGRLDAGTVLAGVLLAPLALAKSALFFALLTRFRLRARTALLSSLNLANYSEFGLIVVAIGASGGLVDDDWLVLLSVALSVSFAVAAALNARSHWLYTTYRDAWRRWQSPNRLRDDRLLDIGNAKVAIIGMGGVGTGAYDELASAHSGAIVGIDIDPVTVRNQTAAGRSVLLGDPADADFWDRVQATHRLDLVLLTLPATAASLSVLRRLAEIGFSGRTAAIAKYPDEEKALREAGADTVYNIYSEAGSAFAAHIATTPGT